MPVLRYQSVIGFSAVLFAMKVLVSDHESMPGETVNQFGFDLPKTMAVWSELFIIQLLVPQSSFLGHVAGILAGLVFLHVLRPATELAVSSFRPATFLAASGLIALHTNIVEKPWSRSSFWMSGSSMVCVNAHQV